MGDALATDTHPLLMHVAGGRGLSRLARQHFEACERQEAITYVPIAVVWETSVLEPAGRIRLAGRVRGVFERLFSNAAFQPLDLDAEQAYLASEARPNEDPFDALICAAALHLGMALLTRDRAIQDWGRLPTRW